MKLTTKGNRIQVHLPEHEWWTKIRKDWNNR